MERALSGELQALVSAARAWVADLAEEGVDRLASASEARAVEGPAVEERASAVSGAPTSESPPPPRPAPTALPGLFDAPPPWGDAPTLEAVREVLGDCHRCALSEGRTRIVFGDGDPHADLMFVGEGPGAEEDRRGLPFVGRAGELLTAMIEKGLGLPRGDVYICNIVKCRPPGNRAPLPEETRSCSPFLDGQIASVRPKVIVALGKPAASALLGREVAITRVRGTWHEYQGIPVMPTFHPAFVLRQYTEGNRRLVWEDLKAALARARGGGAPGS